LFSLDSKNGLQLDPTEELPNHAAFEFARY